MKLTRPRRGAVRPALAASTLAASAALAGAAPAVYVLDALAAPVAAPLLVCAASIGAAGMLQARARRQRKRVAALLERLAPFAEPYDTARPLDAHERIARGVEALERRLAETLGAPPHSAEDPLTGLPDRLTVMRRGRAEITRARRKDSSLAVALVSVETRPDDPEGAVSALRMLAEMLTQGLRAYDVVGRWDARTFLAILPEAEVEHAAGAVKRLRAACAAAFAGRDDTPRILAGVAVLQPEDASLADPAARAAAALDRAREGGADVESAPGPRGRPAQLRLIQADGAEATAAQARAPAV